MARSPTPPQTERISKRLSEGLDGVAERIDSGFASVRSAIDDLAEHVRRVEARTNARLEAQDTTLTREFGQMEIHLGELRDGAQKLNDRVQELEKATGPAQAAAVAAVVADTAKTTAATVVATAKITAAEVTRGFMGTVAGRFMAVCAGFSAAVLALGQIPNVIKQTGMVLRFLEGLAK